MFICWTNDLVSFFSRKFNEIFWETVIDRSVDTGRKLNVHKTFRRCPGVFWTSYGRSIYVLCLRGEENWKGTTPHHVWSDETIYLCLTKPSTLRKKTSSLWWFFHYCKQNPITTVTTCLTYLAARDWNLSPLLI